MNDEPRARSTDDAVAAKQPWHTPSVEEVEYVETRGGGDPAATYDAPTYAS
jgi:hypothetical protein